jgi:hypothetical protein
MSKIKIELKEYSYRCADGCCAYYGTKIMIDGVELENQNQDAGTILTQVLQHLGYEVELIISNEHE